MLLLQEGLTRFAKRSKESREKASCRCHLYERVLMCRQCSITSASLIKIHHQPSSIQMGPLLPLVQKAVACIWLTTINNMSTSTTPPPPSFPAGHGTHYAHQNMCMSHVQPATGISTCCFIKSTAKCILWKVVVHEVPNMDTRYKGQRTQLKLIPTPRH